MEAGEEERVHNLSLTHRAAYLTYSKIPNITGIGTT
jgi:hypothetical protein